jgi:hypothetical protein
MAVMRDVPSNGSLSASLIEQLVEETRKMSLGFFGFEPPATAEVYGPATYLKIFYASRSWCQVEDHWHRRPRERDDGWPYYLVVLRGQFVRREWGPDAPPRSIATLTWSPMNYMTSFGLSHKLPAALPCLGQPHTISLA